MPWKKTEPIKTLPGPILTAHPQAASQGERELVSDQCQGGREGEESTCNLEERADERIPTMSA